MIWKRFATAAVATLLMAALPQMATAQVGMDPGSSARQVFDQEAPAVESPQTLSRSTFRMLGLTFMWSQMVWSPGAPVQMPAALFLPGDRRWGIR